MKLTVTSLFLSVLLLPLLLMTVSCVRKVPANTSARQPEPSTDQVVSLTKDSDSSSHMMAAVAGIFSEKGEGDSIAGLIRKRYDQTWVMKSRVYLAAGTNRSA